jgi:hypothetical protein
LLADTLRAAEDRERKSKGGLDSGGVGTLAAAREDKLRRTMQVYLTAWLLSAHVDERVVEAHLALIASDMRGF